MNIVNFTPIPKNAKAYAASSTSSTFKITGNAQTDIWIWNPSTSDPVFLEIGDSDVTAVEPTTGASGSLPIPPGMLGVIRGQRGGNGGVYGALIMSSGKTATVYIAAGNGS